jgi:pectate lyase
MKRNSVFIALILFFLTAFCFLHPGCNTSSGPRSKTSYYIDNETGNDMNSGTSPGNAWKSLQRISKQKFKAGDQIYLSGSSHFQESLKLTNLEGTIESPIIISSYGTGKAKVESGDSLAILAQNCKYLKINNIQVSGSGRLKGNTTNGIELINCTFSEMDSVTANGFLYSGIRITGGSDIRITHSKAFDNGYCGINVESGAKEYGSDGSAYKTMKRLYIGYCVAENNPGCPAINNNHSGNGILIAGVTNGLIEFCEAMNNGWDMPREGNGPVGIWAYMCDSITIQHCYAHHNKTSAKGKDGGGFDFDGGIRYSVMQYNLSAFNEGAGYGIFQYSGAGEWKDNIARYNISYNDGSKNGQCGILVWCDPSAVPMTNFHAYNNTIVNCYKYGINFEPGTYKEFIFENNIIQVTSETERFIGGIFTFASFDRNCYWTDFRNSNEKPQPKETLDKDALYQNPKLNLPVDSNLIGNPHYPQDLKYFYLKDGSVCVKAGNKIADNGGYDFWKNPLLAGINPNIGAWQGK